MKRKLKNGNIVSMSPDLSMIESLLKIYSSVQEQIINTTCSDMKVFTTENIVGEYGELLTCEKFDCIQEPPSNKGYDCVDKDGNKIQVKSRWLSFLDSTGKDEFGVINYDSVNDIDYVVIIQFASDFKVNFMYKIPIQEYIKLSYKTDKGYKFKFTKNKEQQIQQYKEM